MPQKSRVLVVDDAGDIREIIRTRLIAAGYDVQVGRTGIDAVRQAAMFRPDGMVLDINMPELDGFGVLEQLKASATLPRTLMLTARNASEDVRRAISLGAKDFLAKPFSETQLLARVARLLA